MFEKFSSPVQTRALTLDAVQVLTGLTWVQVDFDHPQIPVERGVYVWVDSEQPHALRYHGSGSGAGGLRGRLSGQLRWRASHIARCAVDANDIDQQTAFERAAEVPAVQQAAGDRLLYFAVAEPAPWTLVNNRGILPPAGSLEWEHFISALSLLVAGHRGVIGGGAWESKFDTLGDRMTDLAWDRLYQVNGQSWS